MDSLDQLRGQLRAFVEARDWSQFHSPKNLSSALVVEASELLEHFQWMTEEQSRQLSQEKLSAVGFEMADVMCYLLHLSHELNVDLLKVTREKLALNEQRFPVERVKGQAGKG